MTLEDETFFDVGSVEQELQRKIEAAESDNARAYWSAAAALQGPALRAYRDAAFATMRNDALDRFGTRVEKRFTRQEIRHMMLEAGLTDVRFHEGEPYWVAIGVRADARGSGT